MADQPHHDQRHSTGANYSTLEAVSHHPDATPVSYEYSTLEVSPRTDEGRFSTLPEGSPQAKKAHWTNYGQWPPTSPPTSPKVDDTRFSTLEAYQGHNTPISPDKNEGVIGGNADPPAEPQKENWKRKRVCGIPLLFLIIGLVVVLAVIGAVVGGVVGSRKKNDNNAPPPEEDITTSRVSTPKPGNTKKVANQTSQVYFNATEWSPIEYHLLTNVGSSQYRLEDSIPHNKTPEDGVFVGDVVNNGYQQWDMAFVPDAKKPSMPLDSLGFWLRLQETDLVLEADFKVWDDGADTSRKDVPVRLAPFNPDNHAQIWFLGVPGDAQRKRDSIRNLIFWKEPWTLGLGPDNTVQMVKDAPKNGTIWRLFHLTQLPWEEEAKKNAGGT